MSTQQRTAQKLRAKIASDPSNPKSSKWKRDLGNLEAKGYVPKGNRSSLTQTVRQQQSQLLDVETERIRKEYMHTLLYPDDYSYRMPDELTQPTTLYRSLREFSLVANIDGTPNSGRFSFAVKPVLGDLSDPHQFQVGMIDSSVSWPTDFANPNSYLIENLGSNPRIDPMVVPLTSLSPGYCSAVTNIYFVATAATDYTDIFGAGNSILGNLPVKVISTGLTSIPIVMGGATSLSQNSVSTVTLFNVPTGSYNFSPYVNALVNWNATPAGIGHVALFAFDRNYVNVGTYIASPTGSVVSGVFVSKVHEILLNEDPVYNVAQSIVTDERENIFFDSSLLYGIGFSYGNTCTNLAAGFTLTSTYDPALASVSDSGSVVKMRPIACACLVTCTLPEINAGGNIVAYSAPPSDIDNYYYDTSSQIGSLQLWENLARLNKGELIHDGNFKDGAYVWTQPWDKNDCLMRIPTAMNRYGYQGIIVSGQVSPSVALTGNVVVGRVRIAILYEYLTDSRLFIAESCFGSTADLDWILSYLGSQKHASENADHLNKIRSILSSGARLINNSIPALMSGLNTAGKIAALLV